jgi:hypothetical protein
VYMDTTVEGSRDGGIWVRWWMDVRV